MAEWILKYWVEVLFSVVVGVITLLYKRFLSIHKKEQAAERSKFKEEIKTEIKDSIKHEFREEFEKNNERDSRIMETLNKLTTSIDTLTEGLLSVQRREFEADCHKLLDPNHNITLDEF